jgi:predicted Fe-Mo cluster-binding NifX family protein
MKIAVTSTGQTLDSQIDPRFGRAACFVIIDSDTSDFTVIENENAASAGGAGIGSAKLVIDAGAQAVLTGNCGPKAQSTLSAACVKLYTGVAGTVAEAVELLKGGKLTEAASPNVESHFGMGK